MNRQIFVDMDGVLVNLLSAVEQRLGPLDVTTFLRGRLPYTDEELWTGTDAEWWASLPWMSDGQAILKVCEEAVGAENIRLCTTPAPWPGSAEGKLRWIERNMPEYVRRYVLTPDKASCANGRTLLLDDLEGNIENFHQAGGAVLLCPRPWNCLKDCEAVSYIGHNLQEMLQ